MPANAPMDASDETNMRAEPQGLPTPRSLSRVILVLLMVATGATIASTSATAAAGDGLRSGGVSWRTVPRPQLVYDGATGTNQLVRRVLTQDGADQYSVVKTGGTVTAAAAASNLGSNQRELFWPAGLTERLNGQVCATWASESSSGVQQGVALRIVAGTSATRAVTVTKNVWAGVNWVFNVHVWDSSLAEPFIDIGQFDLGAVLSNSQGGLYPLPWRLCVRVDGDRLTFKLWVPAVHAEPGWADPVHSRSTSVPAAWNVPGQLGWYVGHLPPAGSATFNGLQLWHTA